MSRKEKKYNFIYKTICLVTNRFYIGMHSTENIHDGYLGSGSEIKRSIKKYGKENHKIEYLEFYEKRKDLKIREISLVNESLILNPLCMNLQKGGGGPDFMRGLITVIDSSGKTFCVTKNDTRYISGEVKPYTINKVAVTDGSLNYYVDINDSRYLSGELKHVHIGKATVKDKNGNKFHVSINDTRYLSGELVGINKGSKMSESRIQKIKDSLKGKNTKINNSQYGTCWITDGINNKKIKKDSNLPNGYRLGRTIK